MTPNYIAIAFWYQLGTLLLVGCTKPANEPAPVYSVTDDIEEVYGTYPVYDVYEVACPCKKKIIVDGVERCADPDPTIEQVKQGKCP